MNWTNMIGPLVALTGSLAKSGPWGIVAMLVGGLGLSGVIAWLVQRSNASVDARETELAGAAAGTEAVDLRNQAQANQQWLEGELSALRKEGEKK